VHISPGQLLREAAEVGTATGMKAKTYMDRGELVPSDLIIGVVKDRLLHLQSADQGCLLDNFPLTASQASSLCKAVSVDHFIFLDVPDPTLMSRALGRSLDPQTGQIYHADFDPPPPEVLDRLERRADDTQGSVRTRLETYKRQIAEVLPHFQGQVRRVSGCGSPDEVFAKVCGELDSMGLQASEDPYSGHMAFEGCFSEADAERAGFFSSDRPPEVGDVVVSFRKRGSWQRRGTVVNVQTRLSTDWHTGLQTGEEGLVVTFQQESGANSEAWAVFLAPVNDMEYSAICTTAEFQSSHFCRRYRCSRGLGDADAVEKTVARESLLAWLRALEDGDGEAFEIPERVLEVVATSFDEHEDESIWLYTTHTKLGMRTTLNAGKDFSLYYRAINNLLNNDLDSGLELAMPLLQRMICNLLYDPAGSPRLHAGGRVWKGDTQKPVPLNMHRLRTALHLGTVVRFRQFTSTSDNENLARKYMRREDRPGYLWIIDIPKGFWGARDIRDISDKAKESETLFPPYSAFRVLEVTDHSCHLEATDKCTEIGRRASRHRE